MRKSIVLITTALAALVLVPGASAATNFGSQLDVAPADQGVDMIMVQTHNADGTIFAGAPTAGVVTSLTIRVGGSEDTVQAMFLRPVTPLGDSIDFVRIAPDVAIYAAPDGADHLAATPTRVSVQAGDRIALGIPGGVRAASAYSEPFPGAPANFCAYTMDLTAWALGVSRTFNQTLCNRWIPAVRATLEPDADGDGYGDETQDSCSTDASTQGSCPAPIATPAKLAITAVPSTAKPSSSARRRFVITNHGGMSSGTRTVAIKSSKEVRDLKIVGGCTLGRIKRICKIPPIAPGAKVTITVSMKRKQSTRTYLSATSSDISAKTLVKFSKPKK